MIPGMGDLTNSGTMDIKGGDATAKGRSSSTFGDYRPEGLNFGAHGGSSNQLITLVLACGAVWLYYKHIKG